MKRVCVLCERFRSGQDFHRRADQETRNHVLRQVTGSRISGCVHARDRGKRACRSIVAKRAKGINERRGPKSEEEGAEHKGRLTFVLLLPRTLPFWKNSMKLAIPIISWCVTDGDTSHRGSQEKEKRSRLVAVAAAAVQVCVSCVPRQARRRLLLLRMSCGCCCWRFRETRMPMSLSV